MTGVGLFVLRWLVPVEVGVLLGAFSWFLLTSADQSRRMATSGLIGGLIVWWAYGTPVSGAFVCLAGPPVVALAPFALHRVKKKPW